MKEFVFGTHAQFIAMKRNLDAHPGQMSRYSGIQLAEGYSPSPCCLDVARLEDGFYAFRFTPAVTGPDDMPPQVADILANGFTGSFLQVKNTLQRTLAPLAGISPEETLVDPSEAERDERNRRIHGISDEDLTEEERRRASENQGRRRNEGDRAAPPRLPSEQDMSQPPRPFGDEHSSNPRNDEAHGMGSDEPVDAPTRPAGPQISGMPEDLPEEESFRPADMARLRKAMGRKVVGHEAQMDRICRLVANHTGKVNPQRPLTIFMAGGPGTGKTLTAESLQEALAEQGLPYGLVRVNLSEYKDAISSNRMVGAAAGYVGYGDGLAFDPLLSEERQVVLLDEAEKAHSNVQDMLLQIMDKGQLQLASPRQGKSLVDFKRAILIFTSNVPVDESRLQGDGADEALRRMLAEAFKPEFVSRLQYCTFYEPPTRRQMLTVAASCLGAVAGEYGLTLLRTDYAVIKAMMAGQSRFGARVLKSRAEALFGEMFAQAYRDGLRRVEMLAGEDGFFLKEEAPAQPTPQEGPGGAGTDEPTGGEAPAAPEPVEGTPEDAPA